MKLVGYNIGKNEVRKNDNTDVHGVGRGKRICMYLVNGEMKDTKKRNRSNKERIKNRRITRPEIILEREMQAKQTKRRNEERRK